MPAFLFFHERDEKKLFEFYGVEIYNLVIKKASSTKIGQRRSITGKRFPMNKGYQLHKNRVLASQPETVL